jgi:hypothetical protein
MSFSIENLNRYIENGQLDLAKRELKFYKQTEEKGFDDSDLWSLDVTIARFVYPRLKRFKEHCCSRPGNLTDKEWDDYLSQMVEAFEILSSEQVCTTTKEQDRKIRRGLKLFYKYFRALWI